MAHLARRAGVPAAAIMIEPEATSTWQNVAYTAPLVASFDRVIIASDPMHAKRARNYWLEQEPGAAQRVFVSDARRPFESAWSSIPTAIVEIARSARHRWMRGAGGPAWGH
ncbi:MAG: YdcF family protein [Acidimicrobiales bacterium]